MKLTIKGQCDIGGSVNVRTEKHGDENVGAMDISCSVLITRKQLCTLMREDLAVQSLFNEKADNHFEPLFGGKIGMIPLLGKFEKSRAVFKCGLDEQESIFEDCTIAKLKIDPQVGGMTLLKFTLQTKLDDHKSILDWAGSSQPIELRVGKLVDIAKENQQELPMGDPEEAGAADARLDDALKADAADQEQAESEKPAKPKRVRPSRSKKAIAERAAKGE